MRGLTSVRLWLDSDTFFELWAPTKEGSMGKPGLLHSSAIKTERAGQ